MKRLFLGILCLGALLLSFNPAFAHEFLLKPYFFTLAPGYDDPFQIVSSHVYMLSEEMEPLDKVSCFLYSQEGKEQVKLAANENLLTLDGKITLNNQGTYILAAHRQGMIWTKTTTGWKQQSKKGLTGVLKSGLYEKFAKAIINVGTPNSFYQKRIGQTLELIPLKNPKEIKVGQELPVQVLFKGKPINIKVQASYDRFSMHENTYAYSTEAEDNGIAYIKITSPGIWMVRAEHSEKVNSPDYDQHVIRSVLTFEVR